MTKKMSMAAQDRDLSISAAIGLTIMSGLLYVLGYSLSKSLVASDGLSPLQVTFLRCAVILIVGLCAVALPGGSVTWRRLLRPDRAWEQRAAAAALVASNVLAVLAFALLPVTAASALGFTAPLILTLLGGLLLRERIPLGRCLGTLLGFAGMLLIVRPDGEASVLGIAAAFGGALTYAVYQVLIRRLRDAATTLDTILQVALVGVVLLAGLVAADWRPVSAKATALTLLVTMVQTAALASIAAALHRGGSVTARAVAVFGSAVGNGTRRALIPGCSHNRWSDRRRPRHWRRRTGAAVGSITHGWYSFILMVPRTLSYPIGAKLKNIAPAPAFQHTNGLAVAQVWCECPMLNGEADRAVKIWRQPLSTHLGRSWGGWPPRP